MKLKVCGLSNAEEVETCVENEVNYCGFILNYSKSHRYISYERAEKLMKINKKSSKYVGVLVKPSHEELEKFSKLNLDYFQLYGIYNDELLKKIKHISIKTEKMIAGNVTEDKLYYLSKFVDAVDVSGALETNKVKDIIKIKKFINQIKKINNEN